MEKKEKGKPKFPIYSLINYFEGICYENIQVTSSMRSLFYALVYLSMSKGGIIKFKVAYEFLMHISRIGSANTYYKSLYALDDLNIIKYTKGKNRFSHSIIELKVNEYTFSLLKSYWEAIKHSTNIPTIKSTVSSYKDINKINRDTESNNIKDTASLEARAQNKFIPFEVFWALYSKEINRNETEKLWNELGFNIQLEIIKYIHEYTFSTPDKQFRKNPDSFLSNEGWKNEIINMKNDNYESDRRYSAKNQNFEQRSF